MADDDLFFTVRGGALWACWLSGKPAVKLGSADEVMTAMAQFLREQSGAALPAAAPEVIIQPARQAGPGQSMASATSPALALAPEAPSSSPPKVLQDRTAIRHELTILGRIFTARGSRDVTILDLSETGCQFHAPMTQLKEGDHLTVKLGPVGPVEATVRWNRGESLGVQFDSPLYPSVLLHIRDSFDLRKR